MQEKLEKYSTLLHSPDFHNEIHHVLSLEKWEKTCQNAAAWLSHISCNQIGILFRKLFWPTGKKVSEENLLQLRYQLEQII